MFSKTALTVASCSCVLLSGGLVMAVCSVNQGCVTLFPKCDRDVGCTPMGGGECFHVTRTRAVLDCFRYTFYGYGGTALCDQDPNTPDGQGQVCYDWEVDLQDPPPAAPNLCTKCNVATPAWGTWDTYNPCADADPCPF
jgi:hypothetical protein